LEKIARHPGAKTFIVKLLHEMSTNKHLLGLLLCDDTTIAHTFLQEKERDLSKYRSNVA
jgi:hypothetical protein